MLQQAGFHTAMISPFGQLHAAHQYYAGYNEIHNTGQGGYESAEIVTPVIDQWMSNNASNDNWYLHINFWDIHTPYRVPAPYGEPFSEAPLPSYYNDQLIAEHVKRGGPHSAQDLDMFGDPDTAYFTRLPLRITDGPSLKKWIDGYDTAIRYVDDAIARMVNQLKNAGVWEDTVVIISADHGENQGALGIYGEHGTADHSTCNIPFIVRWPGRQAGTVNKGLHYHLDWAPTLMEMLGRADACPELWDGESFAAALIDANPTGRDELILSQCAHVCQRSVRFDDGEHCWLYMRTYRDGFHPFGEHMLFDLAQDPLEEHDVSHEYPNVVREAAFRLANWHTDQMNKMARHCSDVVDPMWTVIYEGGPQHARMQAPGEPGSTEKFEQYLTRLEETGRQEAAEDLRRRYPTS